jgi:hypothetical protein
LSRTYILKTKEISKCSGWVVAGTFFVGGNIVYFSASDSRIKIPNLLKINILGEYAREGTVFETVDIQN